MGSFEGSDDIFDAALNVEGAAFEKGRADGEEDAKMEGFYDDGVKSGFMRGFALGLELGFIEEVATVTLQAERNSNTSSSSSSSSGGGGGGGGGVAGEEAKEAGSGEEDAATSVDGNGGGGGGGGTSTTRNAKRLTSLVEKASLVPNTNIATVDFDAQLRELRALFKLTGSIVGPFRHVEQEAEDKKRSQEW